MAAQPGALVVEELQLRSDLGHAAIRGRLDSAAITNGRHDLELRGSVDVAKLATMLPRALRIRSDTTITSGPNGHTWQSGPAFAFRSTVTGSTFECRVDGGAFSPCSSPFVSPALALGGHDFEVRATSAAGVTDPSPARRSFSVNSPEHHRYHCDIREFPRLRAGDIAGCRIITASASTAHDWTS